MSVCYVGHFHGCHVLTGFYFGIFQKLVKLFERLQPPSESESVSNSEDVNSLVASLVNIGHSLADIETKTMIVVFKTALR